MFDSRLDPTERATAVLAVGYGATLAVVAVVGDPLVWLVWSVAAVLGAGAALVWANRVRSAD